MVKTTSKRSAAKPGGGVNPQIAPKIAELAKVLATTDAAQLNIGRICDEIIGLVGIQYGGHTFKTIANHPEIQCDERHLRRCWKYFRLVIQKEYDSSDMQTLIKVKPRGVMELARILDTDMPDNDKKELVKAMAVKAVQANMAVVDIAMHVTEELKRRNKLLRNPPDKKIKAHNKFQAKRGASPAVVDSETLKQYAECIRAYGSHDKIESINDQFSVKAVTVAVVDVIAKQAEQLKPDGEYADFIRKQIGRLEQIRRSLLNKDEPKDVITINTEHKEA